MTIEKKLQMIFLILSENISRTDAILLFSDSSWVKLELIRSWTVFELLLDLLLEKNNLEVYQLENDWTDFVQNQSSKVTVWNLDKSTCRIK